MTTKRVELSKKEIIKLLKEQAQDSFAAGVRCAGLRDYHWGELNGLKTSLYYLTGVFDSEINEMMAKLVNLFSEVVDISSIEGDPAALADFYKTLRTTSHE